MYIQNCLTFEISKNQQINDSKEQKIESPQTIMSLTSQLTHFTSTTDLSSRPLFSTLIAIYILVLLYFPNSLLLRFISSSPVIISAVVLCLNLLRLGASQAADIIVPSWAINKDTVPTVSDSYDQVHKNSFDSESFVEWDVRAPLEVIHEEDEEGEDDNSVSYEQKREADMAVMKRYASLSLFYPETDSDASSEGDFPANGNWDSPEDACFRWEDEDDREWGLIEIALDRDQKKIGNGLSEVDREYNLIEIDLFQAKPPHLPVDL